MALKYTIPHVESIPFILTDGKEIIIEGAPTPVSNRFSINLCTDTDYNSSEIAIHFNPRFDMNQVVLTHKPKGLVYGPEENKAGLPFNRGVYFQLKILAKNDVYQIDVNKTTYTFCHRVAKEKVRYLHIIGDVTINKILYSDVLGYTVPHVEAIPFTLEDGKEIVIEGMPTSNCYSFIVSLCTGKDFNTCDEALHFNPRLNLNLVVLTHKLKDQGYSPEERKEGMPFSWGVAFQLKIFVKKDAYQIVVNNTASFSYSHRVAKENVKYIHILGDVIINKIHSLDVNSVPYYAPIPVTLAEGIEMFFEGALNPNYKRFCLDLYTGDNFDICDTALNFEVNFDEKVVSMTHRVKGVCGPVEKYGCVPLKQANFIQLKIVVRKYAYQIVFNNTTFTFSHRIAMETVRYLSISGDVQVTQVSIPDVVIKPFKYTIPYVESIPFTLTDGKEIIIEGAPTPVSNRFIINLCNGTNVDTSDIILHFNPRFDDNQVVLTHKNKGQGYGPEERKGGLPFSRGVFFQLRILVRDDAYLIVVNNTTFTFCHRVAKENARYLQILGDVTINKTHYSNVNSVPHCAPRPVALTEGTELYFELIPLPSDKRFILDLLTGDNFDTCNTALRFEIRFDEKVVNTTHRLKAGDWGPVEKHGFAQFKQGDVLYMKIVVRKHAYQIDVNNTTFTFNHRVAIETVHYFVVTGDVNVYKVSRPDVVAKPINVQLPYSAHIPFTLTEGKEIFVEGKILPNFNRISFDLSTGENLDFCDATLHFEVRFDEKMVSMTQRVNGREWGPGEKHGVQFSKSDIFQLKLLVRKDAFKLYVNNTAYLFNYCVTIEKVRYLIVSSDLCVNKVTFPDVVNLPVSHSELIPFTLTEGKEMFVEGNIPNNCNRFTIDLFTGDSFDICDTALHFEVRFDEKVVSMTNRDKNGNWGPIEKPTVFPFKQGDVLQLKIAVRKDAYQIIVNYATFTFVHRVAMETVRYLCIGGDVQVNKVSFPDMVKVSVPYSAKIPFILAEGKEIYLEGDVPLNCNRFSINLCSGENFDTCDTALHCEVRFDEKLIIMTHRIKGGEWGPLQKHGCVPLTQGDSLMFKLVVRKDFYQIVVNNETINFNHRVPMETVRYLLTSGHIHVNKVSFSDVYTVRPTLSYSAPILFTLAEGKEILVEGVLPPYSNRFSINLCSEDNFNTCDIALHYEVRFDENLVNMTHRIKGGEWGPVEKDERNPFIKGATFQLKILIKKAVYQIVVNNTTFTFKHRIAKESVHYLVVNGDVNVSKVSFPDVVSFAQEQQFQIC